MPRGNLYSVNRDDILDDLTPGRQDFNLARRASRRLVKARSCFKGGITPKRTSLLVTGFSISVPPLQDVGAGSLGDISMLGTEGVTKDFDTLATLVPKGG